MPEMSSASANRAILGILAYTGARVGAVAKLRLSDYQNLGEGRVLRFREKGGKDREIPVRHDLAAWLDEYMNAASIAEHWKGAPLFRAADGKRKVLTPSPYGPHLMRQMMKPRLEDPGIPELFSPHSFRVTLVTDLLNQNLPLEGVRYLTGHQPDHDAHIRSSPAQGHAEYRRTNFDLEFRNVPNPRLTGLPQPTASRRARRGKGEPFT